MSRVRTTFIVFGLFMACLCAYSVSMAQEANSTANQSSTENIKETNITDEEGDTEEDVSEEDIPDVVEPPKTPEELQAEAQAAREEAELRIEAEMVNMTSLLDALAKNLGQMHYLRTLCFGSSDQKWRSYASEMMALESLTKEDNRRRLVRAFNAGYYQEKDRHTECNRNVSVDVAALAENGRHLASMLGDPYRDY